MLIHVLDRSPASVACSAVDERRLQKTNLYCPQNISLIDFEENLILFFFACLFLGFLYLAEFHKECVCSCLLVAMPVLAAF